MKDKLELTTEEVKAISKLQNATKNFPTTLWLFVANGTIYVMKCNKDGDGLYNSGGGVDQKYIVDTITGVTADGGDW
jgi:hypothetical protein